MLLRNPIWRFVVTFCVLYALLAIPWPGVQERYSSAYRRAGNALFDRFGKHVLNESGKSVKLGWVEFRESPTMNRTSDTVIWHRLRRSKDVGVVEHSPRLTGFLPAVEFIALALATPIAWRRRVFGLLLGLVLVHGFILLRLWMAIRFTFTEPDTYWQMYEAGGVSWAILRVCHEAINVAPVASFAVPALLWLMLLFRPADWTDALGALIPDQDVDDRVTDESGQSGSVQ